MITTSSAAGRILAALLVVATFAAAAAAVPASSAITLFTVEGSEDVHNRRDLLQTERTRPAETRDEVAPAVIERKRGGCTTLVTLPPPNPALCYTIPADCDVDFDGDGVVDVDGEAVAQVLIGIVPALQADIDGFCLKGRAGRALSVETQAVRPLLAEIAFRGEVAPDLIDGKRGSSTCPWFGGAG